MGFSDRQVSELRRGLSDVHIRQREIQGRMLSYIEGWHAIAEANRIFGFDGWDRETVDSKCLLSRDNRGSVHTVYLAKVRITVRAEGIPIIREGFGVGEAHGTSPGESHEKALKTAETDATKRALATFGKPFGLSLYLSSSRPDGRLAAAAGANGPAPAQSGRGRSNGAQISGVGGNGVGHSGSGSHGAASTGHEPGRVGVNAKKNGRPAVVSTARRRLPSPGDDRRGDTSVPEHGRRELSPGNDPRQGLVGSTATAASVSAGNAVPFPADSIDGATPDSWVDQGIDNPLSGRAPVPNDDRRRTRQAVDRSGRYYTAGSGPTLIDPALAGRETALERAFWKATEAASASPASPSPTLGIGQDAADAASDRLLCESGPDSLHAGAEAVAELAPLRSDVLPAEQPKDLPALTDETAATTPDDARTAEVAGEHTGEHNRLSPSGATNFAPEIAPTDIDANAATRWDAKPHDPDASRPATGLLIDWPKRLREPEHLRYVRTQPCLLCGRTPCDAHHLRFAQRRALGRKVSDEFTVPLCRVHHRQLHQSGKEVDWWSAVDRDVDPLEIAKQLWAESRKRGSIVNDGSVEPAQTGSAAGEASK